MENQFLCCRPPVVRVGVSFSILWVVALLVAPLAVAVSCFSCVLGFVRWRPCSGLSIADERERETALATELGQYSYS